MNLTCSMVLSYTFKLIFPSFFNYILLVKLLFLMTLVGGGIGFSKVLRL